MKIRQARGILFSLILLDGILLGTVSAVIQTEFSSQKIRSDMKNSGIEGSAVNGFDINNSGKRKSVMESSERMNLGEKTVDAEVLTDQKEKKLVALTFDDGPSEDCTGVLLDGLKERGIRATFFLMGENIPGKEELVLRMRDEGHLIANHGYRHVQMTHEGEEAVAESVEKAQEMIQEITGERPEFLRPPYGDWNERLAERCDLTTVFWNVDSLDWKLRNAEKIVRRVKKQVRNGDIILMHDIFPESVEAALRLADQLLAEGYGFVTVDEVLID